MNGLEMQQAKEEAAELIATDLKQTELEFLKIMQEFAKANGLTVPTIEELREMMRKPKAQAASK